MEDQEAFDGVASAVDAGFLPHGMIDLHDCWKSYGSVQALSSIYLQIPAVRTVVLIEPSGCGKSTLLRLIVGLVRPDQGEIRLDKSEFHCLYVRHTACTLLRYSSPHLPLSNASGSLKLCNNEILGAEKNALHYQPRI